MYYVIIISMMIAYAWNLRYNFLSSAFFLQFVLHVCALSILSINGINEAIFVVWKKHKKQGETHLDTAHLPFSFKINWGVFFFSFLSVRMKSLDVRILSVNTSTTWAAVLLYNFV